MGIPMHCYGLRYDGLASSPAEKDLKYPAEKVITVDYWVNRSQEYALIVKETAMSFMKGGYGQQTGENLYPPLLGPGKATSVVLCSVLVVPFQKTW